MNNPDDLVRQIQLSLALLSGRHTRSLDADELALLRLNTSSADAWNDVLLAAEQILTEVLVTSLPQPPAVTLDPKQVAVLLLRDIEATGGALPEMMVDLPHPFIASLIQERVIVVMNGTLKWGKNAERALREAEGESK